VIVLKEGKTVFEGSYGLANLEIRTPISPLTNFRLAAFTKQFTAMCMVFLVHDGGLSYDDTLTKIFQDFPAFGSAITVRMMLTHILETAPSKCLGILESPAGAHDRKIPQIKDAQILTMMKQQTSTDFPPGGQWHYSNASYAMLAMIVEKVSGKPFGEFLHERIFAPLGRKNTLAYERGKNEVPQGAFGYTNREAGGSKQIRVRRWRCLGDGGIYSNVEDLARCDQALREHTLLIAAEMQTAFTPVKVSGGAKKEDGTPTDYSFGWFLDPSSGRKRTSHSGTTTGFRTFIERFTDEELTIIILCNRDGLQPGKLADRVADLYKPPVSPLCGTRGKQILKIHREQ
jgi:CubicO group peptidase (beta-lactamase class C family)